MYKVFHPIYRTSHISYSLPKRKLTGTGNILNFICLVLKRSTVPIQNLPPPENYGWELKDRSLVPIMTNNLPTLTALIELSVCGCKGDCSTKRCKCSKNELVCTDMCKCNGCTNNDDDLNCSIDEVYSDASDFEDGV
jgi:hypothetical protein